LPEAAGGPRKRYDLVEATPLQLKVNAAVIPEYGAGEAESDAGSSIKPPLCPRYIPWAKP
jgi:hypothetical protein